MSEFTEKLRGAAARAGLFLAVLIAVPVAAVAGDAQPQMAAASEISAECSAAQGSLETAKDLAVSLGSAYRSALYSGQAHVVQAYHLSLIAPWPASLEDTRTKLNNSFVTSIGRLSHLDRPSSSMTTKDIRSAIQKEIVRMDLAIAMLGDIAPAAAPIAVPPTPAAPGTVPEVMPGNGFAGATAQPATIGSGDGADAKAIARWNAVPFQTFSDKTTIGVIAFHKKGINRVEFSAAGGPWVATTTMTLNTFTSTWEYCFNLDPKNFTDGKVEVRAVVYPNVGMPRVLGGAVNKDSALLGEHSLTLVCNGHGTYQSPVRYVDPSYTGTGPRDGSAQKPFANVYQALYDIQYPVATNVDDALNNATIYLQPGNYTWGNGGVSPYPHNTESWVTICPAPGVSRADVIFNQSDWWGLYATYIRLKNCTVKGTTELVTNIGPGSKYLWVDGCDFQGAGRLSGAYPYRGGDYQGVWVTSTSMRGYTNGAIQSSYVRDVQLGDLLSDAFTNSCCVVNSRVDGISADGSEAHPDVWQLFGAQPSQNLILYGVRAVNSDAQGIFVGTESPLRDCAIVNVHISRPYGAAPTDPTLSQWGTPSSHVLMWNLSLPNTGFMWRTAQLSNISIVGSVFGKMYTIEGNYQTGDTILDSWFKDCHFIDSTSYVALVRGTGATTGDAGYVNVSQNNYTPAANSVLRNRITAPLVPVDLGNALRTSPDTVGPVH